jgi:hypothetical protein
MIMANKEHSADDLLRPSMNAESSWVNPQWVMGPATQAEAPTGEVGEKKPDPAEVLAELYVLLEDYAPAWYKPVHHQKAEAALGVALAR